MKYFFKQYWRYIAMALAFATFNFFVNSCDVHAETISDYRMSVDVYYRIGNSGSFSSANPRYTNFQTNQQGQTLQLEIYAWLQSDVSMAQQVVGTPNVWGRYTICADRDSFTEGYNVANTTNVTFINTSIPCKLANAPNYSNAYITFATFKSTNIQNVTEQNYGNNGKITFDIPGNTIASTFLINSSWTLIAFELSFNQFPTYSQDSAVFDKLDTMISAINTLISQSNNSNVVSAINGTTNAINNQTNTITNAQNQTTNAINGVNDSINNSNTDGGQTQANNFFNNFDSGQTGSLMDLVSLPLEFLNSLNNTCTPISITIPFFNQTFELPCLRSSLSNAFGGVVSIIVLVINALLCYRLIKGFIDIIHNLKDPNNDEIEVMDL